MEEAAPDPLPPSPRWVWLTPYVAGIIVLVAAAGWLALWLTWRSQAHAVLLTNLALVTGGKLAAISIGLAAGGQPLFVSAYVLAGDLVGLLALFPFTQESIERWLVRTPRLGRWIQRMQRSAGDHPIVARFGPFGLFLLALIPFSLNSPMLDAFIGRLAGLRPHKVIAPLLTEMILMNAVYLWLFTRGLEGFDGDRNLILLAVGGVVITTGLILGLTRAIRRRRRASNLGKTV